MASSSDPSDFVDAEYQSARRTVPTSDTTTQSSAPARAPTREEMEAQVTDVQAELARLRQAQEQLERERAALEEAKRRQAEWKTGREEMIQHLTRGVGLLEEAEFPARHEAEQMAKALVGLREALTKVQAISDESWTKENFQVEITRALTTLENARMEWNSARLKFALLNGPSEINPPAANPAPPAAPALADRQFFDLCRLGLALTWPLALGLGIIVLVLLLR
jgi:small-conductance mechanosensitive channel